MANKRILLVEPGYKNKYPPLGLMKIAQYHGPRGKGDNVVLVKGEKNQSVLLEHWDRIYVTTLFSFEWKKTGQAIDFALEASANQPSKVFVGGIAASLMQEEFQAQPQWAGVRFIKGLLTAPPARALQLDSFSDELYSDDLQSTPIEHQIPDYSILDQIKDEYEYHVTDAYFTYASRGCIRKCTFCGVPKLEGDQWDTESISAVVRGIEDLYGPKKDLVLMDNNVTASGNFKNIMAEIRDLGFQKGAKLSRNGTTVKRRVDFNQGVDARILCKDPMFLKEMSTICLKPLRIAFDNWGFRKVYEQSVRYAHDAGLEELSNYMLYNFYDSPSDLYSRLELNVQLREELGIRIFSFPMRYQPTTLKDRSFIGKKWNKYYLRSIQIILQATHGIASGSPSFFRNAFGSSHTDFERLLIRPHHYTFNRAWFEIYGGKPELEDFEQKLDRLSEGEKESLLELLSTHFKSEYSEVCDGLKNSKMRDIMRHYIPLSTEKEREIWNFAKEMRKGKEYDPDDVPVDEKVEDAGLQEAI